MIGNFLSLPNLHSPLYFHRVQWRMFKISDPPSYSGANPRTRPFPRAHSSLAQHGHSHLHLALRHSSLPLLYKLLSSNFNPAAFTVASLALVPPQALLWPCVQYQNGGLVPSFSGGDKLTGWRQWSLPWKDSSGSVQISYTLAFKKEGLCLSFSFLCFPRERLLCWPWKSQIIRSPVFT